VTGDPPNRDRPRPPAGSRTILLVEDDPEVRALFASYLQQAGHRVIEAVNGADALAAVRPGQQIDLLVTDVVMPKGDGPALAATLRRQQPGMKVLYVSGYGMEEAMPNEPTHLTGYLQKPLTRAAFMGQVAEFLGRTGPPRA
jgi:two-component system cell cycle sensor histidine kinase/response regulator CckA